MKKIIKFIPILLLISTAIYFGGCKENEKEITQKLDVESIKRQRAPLPTDPVNYCWGCGQTTNPEFLCLYLEEYYSIMCVEGGCPQEGINNLASSNGLPWIINDSISYEIRDSFLINTLKGQQYITYFYTLGQFALDSNVINLGNIATYYNFAQDIQSAANTMMYGAISDVPVTSAFKNTAMSFISDFRTNSPDTTLTQFLDSIENDLNQFHGLTNNQIFDIVYND